MPSLLSTEKRGTELRLNGLVMSDSVGVGRCASVTVTLQCTRCRGQRDETIRAERCVCVPVHGNTVISIHPPSLLQPCLSAVFPVSALLLVLLPAGTVPLHLSYTGLPRPSRVREQTCHALQLHGIPSLASTVNNLPSYSCVPVDLILMKCETTLSCLECGRDNMTSGLNYGEHRDIWCKRCHLKLSVYMEQCRFVQHQPGATLLPTSAPSSKKSAKKREAVIQIGKPLPELGTCDHYKKSNRWLR